MDYIGVTGGIGIRCTKLHVLNYTARNFPNVFAGAYCVFRRGYGAEKFPLWSFFNLRALRVSCLEESIAVSKLYVTGENYNWVAYENRCITGPFWRQCAILLVI